MSNPLDLTGKFIAETYERLLQVYSGDVYDGNGNYLFTIGSSGGTGGQGVTGPTGPTGPSIWGGITGDVNSQTDLIDYLNNNYYQSPTGGTGEYVRGDGALSPFGSDVLNTGVTGLSPTQGVVSPTDSILRAIEKLSGNALDYASTGAFVFGGLSIASPTTFNCGAVQGFIIDNTTSVNSPTAIYVSYPGATGLSDPNLTTSTETYVLLNSSGSLVLQSTLPTSQDRRQNIYLGKLGHPGRDVFINAFSAPDIINSSLSQLRDIWTPINLINSGIFASPNGANLNINTTSGILYGLGIGWTTDPLSPSAITVNGQSPATFQYRTQTGGGNIDTQSIDPNLWDNGGTTQSVGGGANSSTNQRIYVLQNGRIRVQYGQFVYSTLSDAIAGIQQEPFVTFPNFRDNAILIGILSVKKGVTDLSNPNNARFLSVSKFGETVGSASGISTTTLQQAYNNSAEPEIVTNSSLDGFTIRRGSTADSDAILIGQNGAGNNTFQLLGNGKVIADTVRIPGIGATAGSDRVMVIDANGDVYYQNGVIGQPGATGATGPAGAGGATGYYGSFYDTTTQVNAGATAANVMTINTQDTSNGVYISSGSRITVDYPGIYNLQFSAVFSSSNSSSNSYDIWLAKNGVPVSESNTRQALQGSGTHVSSWNFLVRLQASDYLELYWSSTDTSISILAQGASVNPTRPAIPSLIVTLQQVTYTQRGETGGIGATGPTGPQGATGAQGATGSLAAGTSTGTVLTFTSDRVYGTLSLPESGSISANVAGGILGVTNIIIHNNGSTGPTFSSEYRKLSGSGIYATGQINYIYCTYIESNEIIYSINQRT